MIQSIESGASRTRQLVHLSNVDWSTYEQLLRIFEQHPGHRLAFDEGELEIMTPSLTHDDDSDFLGHCVRVLAEELGLPLRGGGSVTMKREDLQKGIEPDRCFWIPREATRRRLAAGFFVDLNPIH